MEPCPYRQGELRRELVDARRVQSPQWSPALIGRERTMRGLQHAPWWHEPQWSPALIGRERRDVTRTEEEEEKDAAMEPCPYRQGEPDLAAEIETVRYAPQWSPALIGRERPNPPLLDQPSPPGRNGALPLSAGRGPP